MENIDWMLAGVDVMVSRSVVVQGVVKMRAATRAVGLALGLSLLTGVVWAQPTSGFLGDSYGRLTDAKTPSGATVKRWISPDVKPGAYELVLLQKAAFYPEPQGTDQLSSATLGEISAYMDTALRREFEGVVKFASEPGPKTLSFRPAITAAAVKGLGLKPHQYLPLAFVVTKATGKESKGAALAVEFEAKDVETNQVVAAGVREGTGVELKSADEKLTLDHFKPLIDAWVKDVRATVEASKLVRTLK